MANQKSYGRKLYEKLLKKVSVDHDSVVFAIGETVRLGQELEQITYYQRNPSVSLKTFNLRQVADTNFDNRDYDPCYMDKFIEPKRPNNVVGFTDEEKECYNNYMYMRMTCLVMQRKLPLDKCKQYDFGAYRPRFGAEWRHLPRTER